MSSIQKDLQGLDDISLLVDLDQLVYLAFSGAYTIFTQLPKPVSDIRAIYEVPNTFQYTSCIMRKQLLQDILKSHRSISGPGLFMICHVLLVVCLCTKELCGAKIVMYSDGLREDSSVQGRLCSASGVEFRSNMSVSTHVMQLATKLSFLIVIIYI